MYCRFLSEVYAIEDCTKYDDASSDRSSNFIITGTTDTISYNSNEQAYQCVINSTGGTRIDFITSNSPTSFKYSVKMKLSNGSNVQPRLDILDGNNALWVIFSKIDGKMYLLQCNVNQSISISYDTWYTLELTINGTTATYKVTDANNNTVGNITGTLSSAFTSNSKIGIVNSYDRGTTIKFKDIMIKPL